VSPGATPIDSGNRLQAALASITDASGTNRYLVKLEPGFFQVTSGLQMKQWVDIEGSGTFMSKITSTPDLPTATVLGANSSELRHLTVDQTGTGGSDAVAFSGAAGSSLSHVFVQASGPGSAIGLSFGSWNATMTNVQVAVFGVAGATVAKGLTKSSGVGGRIFDSDFFVTGGSSLTIGIEVTGSGVVTVRDSIVAAQGPSPASGTVIGLDAQSSNFARVMHSEISGSNAGSTAYGVRVAAGSGTSIESSQVIGDTNSVIQTAGVVRVAVSQLNGPASGTMTCVGAYSGSFAALDASCA
jgi:hypothetical protein